jgi:hypothetical protein
VSLLTVRGADGTCRTHTAVSSRVGTNRPRPITTLLRYEMAACGTPTYTSVSDISVHCDKFMNTQVRRTDGQTRQPRYMKMYSGVSTSWEPGFGKDLEHSPASISCSCTACGIFAVLVKLAQCVSN